jgi:hypothetical protein
MPDMVILRSFHVEEDVGVGGSRIGVEQALPGKLDVMGGDRRAVAPGAVIMQAKRVDTAVGRDYSGIRSGKNKRNADTMPTEIR